MSMFERITPPAAEPFTLSDLKAALRITHAEEDELVMRLGIAARALVERRLGHAIAAQGWRLTHRGPLSGALTLRPGPVRTISAVALRYGEGAFEDAPSFRLLRGHPDRVLIEAAPSKNGVALEEAEVTFEAGRQDPDSTPEELVQAITLLAAHYYENREAVAEGRYVALPSSVETLLAGLREVRL
jgi:uncharacterized phiE125 gp8 family phage protein